MSNEIDSESSLIDFDSEENDLSDEPNVEEIVVIPAASTHAQSKARARAAFDELLQKEATGKPPTQGFGIVPSNQGYKDETARIIDKAREYQQELFQRAKEENIIAVLDTGSVHLAVQQGNVLRNNLPEPPIVLYGDVKNDLWKKINWEAIRNQSRVVVCTAAILDQCLMHSFVKIADISLLIFDEAHHTKKGHPYAKIMLDYYMRSDLALGKPRIFGMTASPIQSKGDIMKAAEMLEAILHAKIVTTSSMSLNEHAPRARNEEWEYDRLPQPCDTDLSRKLRLLCNIKELNVYFDFARTAHSTLGSWAAHRVWRYVFSPKQELRLKSKLEQSEAYQKLEGTDDRNAAIHSIEAAAKVVNDYHLGAPVMSPDSLSPKVLLLAKQLKHRYHANPKLLTIVFVEQRMTAELLNDCFSQFRIDQNLRPGVLLGVGQSSLASNPDDGNANKQAKLMKQFRDGHINCMFATSVAEEGIDVPQCSLVVRFDLFNTPIQYMQSRGRARMQGSVYAMMLEQGNFAHRRDINYAVDSEEYIKDFCARLSKDRILELSSKRLDRLIAKEAGNKTFETISGATCSFNNSLLILSRYASSLQYTGAETSSVLYNLDIKDGSFRYTVKLPSDAPGSGIKGDFRSNKSLAKRSAAFACCYFLREGRELDENLDSVHIRCRPEGANAHLAVSGKTKQYAMKIKPDLWLSDGTALETLFATVVHLVPKSPLRHPLSSFLLLTRHAMPTVPLFPIYLEHNIQVDIAFKSLPKAFQVSTNMLQLLTAYTLDAIYYDVFNKKYEHDSTILAYWLAPTSLKQRDKPPGALESLVNMEELSTGTKGRVYWKTDMSPELWSNKFLVDERNGQYHYITNAVVPGATIESEVPLTARNVARKGKSNVLDFTNSLWRNSKNRNRDIWDQKQPVLAAEIFLGRRDFLEKSTELEVSKTAVACHIVPQPLAMSQISTSMAASCMAWPAVSHRLEAYLIVLEAFAKLDLQVPAELALEAFTKAGNNNDDEQQTHSQSLCGMGKNYERLEFIGDSLLKMTTTLSVFCKMPKSNEEGMHVTRMNMLCNENLLRVATNESLELFQYARTSGFNRLTWYPEGLTLLSGRGAKNPPEPVKHEKVTHDLGDKTIADISEAIIGAALVAGRSHTNPFDMSIKAITKLVGSENHQFCKWSDIAPLYKAPAWQLVTNDPIAVDLALKVEQAVGITHRFRYPRLARSAFTHPSDKNSPVQDYQRLEFLGDAVLDMVSINWMFTKYEDKNPQWLTEHKMAMVSNKFLAALAVTLGFDKLIKNETVSLAGQITDYAHKVRETWDLGKENISPEFWTQIDNPPKALSDLVESYIGAIMVDSGFNYQMAVDFFEKHILWFFEDIDLYSGFANRHPTSYLTKKLTNEYRCMDYHMLCSEPRTGQLDELITAGVLIHGRLIADSSGTSSKYARVRASKKCLQILDGVSIDQFREKYGCFCRRKEELALDQVL